MHIDGASSSVVRQRKFTHCSSWIDVDGVVVAAAVADDVVVGESTTPCAAVPGVDVAAAAAASTTEPGQHSHLRLRVDTM